MCHCLPSISLLVLLEELAKDLGHVQLRNKHFTGGFVGLHSSDQLLAFGLKLPWAHPWHSRIILWI